MSNTVEIRHRSYLPGVGFDGNGQPSSRKQMVNGRINVTSFTAGESLTAADVGLTTIDSIQMDVTEGMGGASGEERRVRYSLSAQEFYITQSGSTSGTVGNNYTVAFTAFGDSALAPQLV